MGDQKDNLSIMPLIPDRLDLNFPQEAPDLGPRPQMLSDDAFANAFLEAGQKVDGVRRSGLSVVVAYGSTNTV